MRYFVKPIHYDYKLTLELIEFIELNKILGVNKFTFYNHTMSKEVSCVLEKYISEGNVEVLPWKLNVASQKEIRTEGLFAALNDCLYRNMNTVEYLMLIGKENGSKNIGGAVIKCIEHPLVTKANFSAPPVCRGSLCVHH